MMAIAIATAAFAGTGTDPNNSTRIVRTENNIRSLVVNGKTSVVLVNTASKEIVIEGMEDAIDQILVLEKNGELSITNHSKKGRTAALVYVPAMLINKISMNGNGAVSSTETLYNSKIDVLVNGDCKLWIKTYGDVSVDATPEYDYTFETRKIKE